MSLEDAKTVPNPDPEEEELLIEWANERPNVERLLTGPPVVVDERREEEIWLESQVRETFGGDEVLGPWHWPLIRPFGIIKEWVVRVWRLLNHG